MEYCILFRLLHLQDHAWGDAPTLSPIYCKWFNYNFTFIRNGSGTERCTIQGEARRKYEISRVLRIAQLTLLRIVRLPIIYGNDKMRETQ